MYYQKQCLNDEIQKSGCYFLCHLRMVEIVNNIHYTQTQITHIWNKAKKLGFIDANNNLVSPNDLLSMLESSVRQVGSDGEYYPALKPVWKAVVFKLFRFKYDGVQHWVMLLKDSGLIYDSMNRTMDDYQACSRVDYYAVCRN